MAFTIKELETLSGIKAHTIRIWEQRYNFLRPSRTQTNIRTYNNEELKTILTVALLNKYGYKISRIDGMAPDQRDHEVLKLQHSEARVEALVNELIGAMIDLRTETFESIVEDYIRQHGLSEALSSIIFLFLEKIGILWQTGRINPAHEHIVSNIIRQKIIAAIDDLPVPERRQPLSVLFLPDDQYHELGLLYVQYLMKQKGLPVLYLGSNVPAKDVVYVAGVKKPQYLYIHLTVTPLKKSFERYLNTLLSCNLPFKILLSGSAATDSHKLPPAVVPLESLGAVVDYIHQL